MLGLLTRWTVFKPLSQNLVSGFNQSFKNKVGPIFLARGGNFYQCLSMFIITNSVCRSKNRFLIALPQYTENKVSAVLLNGRQVIFHFNWWGKVHYEVFFPQNSSLKLDIVSVFLSVSPLPRNHYQPWLVIYNHVSNKSHCC